ncbi:hypothetical protein Trihar35433_9033 [Trichoderma harzianum]|nr:hypothetical protein Trihar35433_9033 [Trichoderma harzianum]
MCNERVPAGKYLEQNLSRAVAILLFIFLFVKLTQFTIFGKLCHVEQPKAFISPERIFQMPPARPEAPRRRQNQLVDWPWVVGILLGLAFETTMNSFMLHRERMATIAVTTITVTTVGPTMPCVCPAPTSAVIDTITGASGAAAPVAASSSVVAVDAPLESLPFLEVMGLFPAWAPWRRLNNPCAFWALGRLGA